MSGVSSLVDSNDEATPMRRSKIDCVNTPILDESACAKQTIGKSSERFSAGNLRLFSSKNDRR